MARLKKWQNPLFDAIRGKIAGTLVIKQYGDRIVISKMPDMSRVKKTRKQVAKRSKFQSAVAYAQTVLADPKKKKAFAKKVKKGQTIYHAAISAYLKGTVV